MKLKINASFILYLVCLSLLNELSLVFYLVISLLLHEIGHLVILKYNKIKVTSLNITAFGGIMQAHVGKNITNRLEIAIYISGPLMNLLMIIIGFILKNNLFMMVNLSLFTLNILPIYPLDGYYLITSIFSGLIPYYNSLKISKILSFLLTLIFFFISFKFNIYLVLLSIMFIFFNLKDLNYKKQYELFILDKYLNPNLFLKNKKVKETNLNLTKSFYRGRNNYLEIGGKVYYEKNILNRYFKT